MRISDWSSDVCSSDLPCRPARRSSALGGAGRARRRPEQGWQLPTNRAVPRSRSRIRDRDRKGGVEGKSVSVQIDFGGRRIIKQKTKTRQQKLYSSHTTVERYNLNRLCEKETHN